MQKTIGKYQIQATIGQGSFGKVYLATLNNQKLALKIINKRGRTQRDITNFKTQTNLLTKAEHQNIIQIKDYFETKEEMVVVMEYAQTDLSEVVKKEGKLPDERVRMYARQILSAMLELHRKRILHRDLKPQNILLKDNIIKICDFGFAKEMSASTNFLKSVKGTPLYIAPEILLSRQYNHKVDIWSFGIILYELATGRQPFYANSLHQLKPKILHEAVRFPSSMDIVLRNLIDGMLQKSQRRRFDWQQVKSHKFFTDYPDILPYTPSVSEKEKQPEEPPKIINWNAEEQCAYVYKMDSQFSEDKITVSELKFSEEFCMRVTQLIGQVCIDRTKVPKSIVLKAIKLVTKLAMKPSEGKQNQQDITKNKTLMTALVTLTQDEADDQLLCSELELIAYLLKQNYNRIKIDTDHDELITTVCSKILAKKEPGQAMTLCLKTLGILTIQAVLTLTQSEQYFQRIAEQGLLTLLAQCYFLIPEKKLVLECLEKFIHPMCNSKVERVGMLTHGHMKTFKLLREEVAGVMLAKGFITDVPLTERNWAKGELQLYCLILMECLEVSAAFRAEFLKHTYWQSLLSGKMTKRLYLSFAHIFLKHNGIHLLSNQRVQNLIEDVDIQNDPLVKTYLLECGFHKNVKLQGQPITQGRILRVEATLSNLHKLLNLDNQLKKQSCQTVLGCLNEGGQYMDTILIDILSVVAHDFMKEESLIPSLKNILQKSITLKIPTSCLLQLLELSSLMNIEFDVQKRQHLRSYLITSISNDTFEDYLTVYPNKCSKLLQHLLKYQQLQQQQKIKSFAELMEQHNFIHLLFSQQLASQEMVQCAVRLVNKLFCRLKKLDVLISSALPTVKNYYKTENEDFRIDLVCFCGNLAKQSKQYALEVYQSNILDEVGIFLRQGSNTLKEKTLHMIGNISKHEADSHPGLRKHKVIESIAKCLEENQTDKIILKNTVYALGNIAFYSNAFACQMRPIIKLLGEGLRCEDEHLVLNTLSTVNNLLRHGPELLPDLIDSGILTLTMDLYRKANTNNQVPVYISVIKKAMTYPLFRNRLDAETIRALKVSLEHHTAKGYIRSDDRNAQGLKRLLC